MHYVTQFTFNLSDQHDRTWLDSARPMAVGHDYDHVRAVGDAGQRIGLLGNRENVGGGLAHG